MHLTLRRVGCRRGDISSYIHSFSFLVEVMLAVSRVRSVNAIFGDVPSLPLSW